MIARKVTASCVAALIAAAILNGQAEAVRPTRTTGVSTKVDGARLTGPSSLRGRDGELLGAAPDPRIRSFFQENGFPE